MKLGAIARRASLKVENEIRKIAGLPSRKKIVVQIELAGKCSSTCEFCDWPRRQTRQKIFMDTNLAKKATREAIAMGADHISFHVTGESLDHPDFFEIVPKDVYAGLSTNCLSLSGENARRLARMDNMSLILAILWSEDEKKRIQSMKNAIGFLNRNPDCSEIAIQMICSKNAVRHARYMYDTFIEYIDDNKRYRMIYKQPYVQEYDNLYIGYMPENIPKHPRVGVDYMSTPQSCGPDCLAMPPNPLTSILVQSDGEIKPCFYRPDDPSKAAYVPEKYRNGWGYGNIRDHTLMEYWNSEWLRNMQAIWKRGDPDNQLPCYNCIRMAVPTDGNAWWLKEELPKKLDDNQALKESG